MHAAPVQKSTSSLQVGAITVESSLAQRVGAVAEESNTLEARLASVTVLGRQIMAEAQRLEECIGDADDATAGPAVDATVALHSHTFHVMAAMMKSAESEGLVWKRLVAGRALAVRKALFSLQTVVDAHIAGDAAADDVMVSLSAMLTATRDLVHMGTRWYRRVRAEQDGAYWMRLLGGERTFLTALSTLEACLSEVSVEEASFNAIVSATWTDVDAALGSFLDLLDLGRALCRDREGAAVLDALVERLGFRRSGLREAVTAVASQESGVSLGDVKFRVAGFFGALGVGTSDAGERKLSGRRGSASSWRRRASIGGHSDNGAGPSVGDLGDDEHNRSFPMQETVIDSSDASRLSIASVVSISRHSSANSIRDGGGGGGGGDGSGSRGATPSEAELRANVDAALQDLASSANLSRVEEVNSVLELGASGVVARDAPVDPHGILVNVGDIFTALLTLRYDDSLPDAKRITLRKVVIGHLTAVAAALCAPGANAGLFVAVVDALRAALVAEIKATGRHRRERRHHGVGDGGDRRRTGAGEAVVLEAIMAACLMPTRPDQPSASALLNDTAYVETSIDDLEEELDVVMRSNDGGVSDRGEDGKSPGREDGTSNEEQVQRESGRQHRWCLLGEQTMRFEPHAQVILTMGRAPLRMHPQVHTHQCMHGHTFKSHCARTHTHVRAHAHAHTLTHTRTQSHKHTNTQTHKHTNTHSHTRAHTHDHVH